MSPRNVQPHGNEKCRNDEENPIDQVDFFNDIVQGQHTNSINIVLVTIVTISFIGTQRNFRKKIVEGGLDGNI